VKLRRPTLWTYLKTENISTINSQSYNNDLVTIKTVSRTWRRFTRTSPVGDDNIPPLHSRHGKTYETTQFMTLDDNSGNHTW